MIRVVALAVLAALVFTACGGSSSHASPTSPTSVTSAPARTTAPSSTTTSTSTTTLPAPQWNAQYTTTTTGPCGADPGAPTQTTARLTVRRRPDAAHPLEVLIVGDSIALTLLPSVEVGFENLAKQTHIPIKRVDSIAFPGFGFLSSRPGIVNGQKTNGYPQFANWPKTFDDAIAKYDPDVVIPLVGSWDMVTRLINGRYTNPTDCAWAPVYNLLLEQAYAHLTAKGARVAWLAFPCTVRPENQYHHLLNATFRSLAARHPTTVAYVDLDRFVCPHGKVEHSMRAPDGRLIAVRGSDNTHFDFYGSPPVMAPFFTAQMGRLLNVPR